jgi:hypothetical protein
MTKIRLEHKFDLLLISIQQLDDSEQPDKSMVIKVMTKKIRDPEVRDFIEESVDDCFELLEMGECVNTQNALNVHVVRNNLHKSTTKYDMLKKC